MERVPVNRFVLDGRIQSRAQLDMMVIQDYAELMQAGTEFPPVDAIRNGRSLYVWDGWHRVRGAQQAGKAWLWANVEEGTFEDAVWKASGANRTHGLRRTNADKRRAVELALRAHPEHSDRRIAEHCGVSPSTVSAARSELSVQIGQITTRTVVRGGTEYTQDTTNIGRREQQDQPQSDYQQIAQEIGFQPPTEKAKASSEPRKFTFNRTNENIEWASWTWNPVTGCKTGCAYCYARDIANRFNPHGFEPHYYPDRLDAPRYTSLPDSAQDHIGDRNVFVCSMGDLFGPWVPEEWITNVLHAVNLSPQWNFLFLTKWPAQYVGIDWPANAWVGTTVDRQARIQPAEEAFAQFDAPVKFLSCEPLLEDLTFSQLDLFDWLIVGAQSKTTAAPEFQPKWEWVRHLENQAVAAGLGGAIYFKPNLDLVAIRPRGYPNEHQGHRQSLGI